jgi:hypothetical protein
MQDELRTLQAKPTLTPEETQRSEHLHEVLGSQHRATADEQKRADYHSLLSSGQVPKDANGQPMSYESWSTYASTQGRQAGAPPKVPHYDNNTGTISDPNTGKVYSPTDLNLPLSVASMFKAADNQQFKKQQRSLQQIAERGQAYLAGKVVQVADPSQPGTTIYMKALDAVRQGLPTPSSIWYKLEMPTGQERGRADLAVSAREQLATMGDILRKRSDLFGPEAGRATDFTKWVGSQDPDAQRFAAAARIASDHLAGVFGGRSKEALEGIYNAISQNKTNPEAAVAALEQMNIAAATIQRRGQGAGADTGTGTGAGAGFGTSGSSTPPPTLPPAARFQLKENHITTFANGQKWTLKNGQPEQVR